MIYKQLSLNEFIQEFKDYNRDNYSYEGYKSLYDYYDGLENFEMDVISIVMEWHQFYDVEEINTEYGEDFETIEDAIEVLEYKTSVLVLDKDGILVASF